MSSSSHDSQSWLNDWWPLLVILFGVFFVLVLVAWKPII